MRILLTGAGGKTGRSLTRALQGSSVILRGWLRRPEALPGLTETVAGDLADPALWKRALDKVDALYLLLPNMYPQEAAVGRLALAAARAAGVSTVVYHSVLHPQTEAMPHHWQKLRVEEALLESGLPFTVLQPTAYMQNLRSHLDVLLADRVLSLPYPPETRLSLVDLDDVAAAAAQVLTTAGHAGATYELVGTQPLSQHQVATILSDVLGMAIIANEFPLRDWRRLMADYGRSGYVIDSLEAMFRYYAAHGLVGNPNVLRWLLGRAPRALPAVAATWMAANSP